MDISSYMSDLWDLTCEKFSRIVFTAFLMFGALPIIIIFIIAVIKIILLHTLDIHLIELMINEAFPWWLTLLMIRTLKNLFIIIAEYLACFVLTVILVHHNILELSEPNNASTSE
jgi:hypothetical protein